MTRRKATEQEMADFVISKLKEDIKRETFHIKHLKVIIEEVYPFSWKRY